MHAVMAVRTEKFEAQLHATDMVLDPADKRDGFVEIGRVDGDIKRVAHVVSPGV